MSEWPPEGYSEPREWEKSDWLIIVTSVIVGVPIFIGVRPFLGELADPLVVILNRSAYRFGFSESPLLLSLGAVGLTILLILALSIAFRWVIVPLHERIHHDVYLFYARNPVYYYADFLFLKNPAVIAWDTGITVRENLVAALSPFAVIGTASLIVIFLIDGFIAGIAAFVLLANSAASGADLYGTVRLLMLPNETLFANFKEGENKYRTEYVYPEE